MEQDKKNVIKFIGIMIIYILLSALGIFSVVGTALFPIVALPFALYCMRNKIDVQLHVIFHVTVSIAIYLIMHSILGVLIYLMSVVIPTYIILFLYKQELPLPNIIMQGGLILAVVVFVYFAVLKGFGIDFEALYGSGLDALNQVVVSSADYVVQTNVTASMTQADIQAIKEAMNLVKEIMNANVGMLKTLYASVIVSQVVMSFAISVILLNAISRHKNKTLPSTDQILKFRVSRVAVLLLMLTMVFSDMSGSTSGAMPVLILNLMNFLYSLFEIVGVLGLIALLRRTSINPMVKIFGYIAIIVLSIMLPYFMMFYGCLDAIFNYRKVDIVV